MVMRRIRTASDENDLLVVGGHDVGDIGEAWLYEAL
jgi:hypothetical protein